MQHTLLQFDEGFRVRIGNARAQAAEMVIQPGASEGGADNRHAQSDQWLLVVSGTGRAIVDGHECRLRKGSLLLIEEGESHEIRCTGRAPLKTVNLYVPPAYGPDGAEIAEEEKEEERVGDRLVPLQGDPAIMLSGHDLKQPV